MPRLLPVLLPIAVAGLALSLGCTKLPSNDIQEGPLELSDAELTEAIPLEFGTLVDVTSSKAFPGWAQLWFQREDQSIVTVYVNYVEKRLEPRALVIPRS